jgi:hypothetical protein
MDRGGLFSGVSKKAVSAARNAFSFLWPNRKVGDPELPFLRVFPGRWTLLRSDTESRNSFAMWKLRFLDANLFLPRGFGNFHVHG